jgi:hypothetical protein
VGEDTDSERAQKREEDQKFNMVSVMFLWTRKVHVMEIWSSMFLLGSGTS